jgi:hypothetical protein
MPTPLGNFFIKFLINSPLHPLLGKSFAVITVTGIKTGKLFSTPINTVRVENVLTVISMRNRTWWRNLRDGGLAKLRQAGKQFVVRGEVIETSTGVISSMTAYFAQYPGYAKYFDIHSGPDGKPDPKELEQLASERVIIRLFPV